METTELLQKVVQELMSDDQAAAQANFHEYVVSKMKTTMDETDRFTK